MTTKHNRNYKYVVTDTERVEVAKSIRLTFPNWDDSSIRREQAYLERQREGNIRHLARRSGATWLKGLDGFAISEENLSKLLDERDQAVRQAHGAESARAKCGMRDTEKSKGAYMMQLLVDKANAEAQVADLLTLVKTADSTVPGARTIVINADAWQAIRAAIARAEKGEQP